MGSQQGLRVSQFEKSLECSLQKREACTPRATQTGALIALRSIQWPAAGEQGEGVCGRTLADGALRLHELVQQRLLFDGPLVLLLALLLRLLVQARLLLRQRRRLRHSLHALCLHLLQQANAACGEAKAGGTVGFSTNL
jgi:hypothetical protein